MLEITQESLFIYIVQFEAGQPVPLVKEIQLNRIIEYSHTVEYSIIMAQTLLESPPKPNIKSAISEVLRKLEYKVIRNRVTLGVIRHPGVTGDRGCHWVKFMMLGYGIVSTTGQPSIYRGIVDKIQINRCVLRDLTVG